MNDNIIKYYKIENEKFWLFYKFYRNETINQTPQNSIIEIIKIYGKNNKYDNFPKYLINFLNKIKTSLDENCDNEEKISKIIYKYDNKNIFINKLNNTMISIIKRCFQSFL